MITAQQTRTSLRLRPYVPKLVIDWLRDTPDLRYRQVEGSLAFVDISGFTNLTEHLSRKGKVGAEEMNQILNACFADFLDSACDFGAGVVKWGGDAVLLLFQGDEHGARAARAAWEMQRAMRRVARIKTGSGAEASASSASPRTRLPSLARLSVRRAASAAQPATVR